jgi:succinoglycan biosynthesis transport protein ExoP
LNRPARFHLDVVDRDSLLPAIRLGDLLRGLLQKLIRRWLLVVAVIGLTLALAVAYVLTATPLYTATGALLIDPRAGGTPDDRTQMMPGLLLSDALTVDSELRVLTSREVTASVVRVLGLQEEAAPGPSWTQRISGWLGVERRDASAAGLTEKALAERRAEALRLQFLRGLEVERAGDSFVIDISYTAPQLALAPKAVNTLMTEYLRLSGAAELGQLERTRAWLAGRIDELGRGVEEAETAVATYRQENQLLAPQGALLPVEIALNAATGDLVRLRGQAVAVEVQIAQLAEQIAAGQIDAVQIPVEERSRALADFETRYSALLQSEQELILDWGAAAQVVQANRQQQALIRDLILAEYRKVLDRLKARADTMNRQVAATERVIADLRVQYGNDTGKTVELRSLEREAEAKRVLYERLLEEYNSTSQLITFDAPAARVIAWAVTPEVKSAPDSKLIVALAAFAGLVLAVGGVLLLDSLDNSFRTYPDLMQDLGMAFLGLVPSFRSDRAGANATARSALKGLPKAAQKFDFAARRPASVSAETMRSIHVRLALLKGPPPAPGLVVGVLSSVRSEGKTTTACNLAVALTRQSARVALVDLDLLSRGLARQIGPILPAGNSLRDLLHDPASTIRQLEILPGFPGLTVIGDPAAGDDPPSATRDAELLEAALTALRSHFDYVVVDLPPLQGVADTQLLARLCDGLIFCIRWGATPKEQVLSALRKASLPRDRFLGAVFTQAPLSAYRSHNRLEVTDYYS